MNDDNEVMISERNKSVFVIDGFKFRFHKNVSNNLQRWTCYKNNWESFFKLNELNDLML